MWNFWFSSSTSTMVFFMRCLANLGASSGRSANLEVIGLKGGGGGGVGKARLGRYRVNDDEWDGEWDDYSILFFELEIRV